MLLTLLGPVQDWDSLCSFVRTNLLHFFVGPAQLHQHTDQQLEIPGTDDMGPMAANSPVGVDLANEQQEEHDDGDDDDDDELERSTPFSAYAAPSRSPPLPTLSPPSAGSFQPPERLTNNNNNKKRAWDGESLSARKRRRLVQGSSPASSQVEQLLEVRFNPAQPRVREQLTRNQPSNRLNGSNGRIQCFSVLFRTSPRF